LLLEQQTYHGAKKDLAHHGTRCELAQMRALKHAHAQTAQATHTS